MSKAQEDLSQVDVTEAATGDARTTEDLLADTENPVQALFWDGARGHRVLDRIYTGDNISVAVASTGNLWIKAIKSRNVTLFCSGSSTLKIPTLECDHLTIHVGYSSTVNLEDVRVDGRCQIDVHYSSTLRLNEGHMKAIEGSISNSSTGCHKSITFDSDKVTTSSGSVWTSFCL
ncbi:MAG TPA: hypothetical protein VLF66_03300 [Thermoanaerobaculia bacterium]|nr:hypothetical protein [Thermoanaerobaculia bacterium]